MSISVDNDVRRSRGQNGTADRKSNSTEIAKTFVERAKTLGLKGKARDRAAIEFCVGAAIALDLAGVKDGGATMLGFLTLTRGYKAVEETANWKEGS